MANILELHEKIINGDLAIDSLMAHRNKFQQVFEKIDTNGVYNEKTVEVFLKLCLDYYVFSSTGDVLISDHDYDVAMKAWTDAGYRRIIYPDQIAKMTTWKFVKHEIPGLVGSLGKLYSRDELRQFKKRLGDISHFRIAPKFDGVSAAIKVVDGIIVYGATRYDGIMGQDITQVILNASNADTFFRDSSGVIKNGYYKCELVVSTDHFEQMRLVKKYANRRSATSGIVSSPKNLHLAKYLTIIPLLHYTEDRTRVYYAPSGYRDVYCYNTDDLLDQIMKMLKDVRHSEFPYRVDGVVIYPISDNLYVNETNLLNDAIAYKINTSEAPAQIEFAYMSVGRLGNAMPMVRIRPTEVNEVTVTDASLGSYSRFLKLSLHENEEVIVYSAGDVIPQIRLQDPRVYRSGSPLIELKKRCPYCNAKLDKIIVQSKNKKKEKSTEYHCTNPDCPRVNTGRITNFIEKLGVMGFSDKTIEDFYNAGLVTSIEDLFRVTVADIKDLPNYDIASAVGFTDAMKQLRIKPIGEAEFLGALGIPNISELKCKKIISAITFSKILKTDDWTWTAAKVANADGIGMITAEIFVDFVKEHRKEIKKLLDIMNIVQDKEWLGHVVFTGFRNDEAIKKFNDINIEVRDGGVSRNTLAVISGSTNHSSTKCRAADRYGIPIYDYEDIDLAVSDIKNRKE